MTKITNIIENILRIELEERVNGDCVRIFFSHKLSPPEYDIIREDFWGFIDSRYGRNFQRRGYVQKPPELWHTWFKPRNDMEGASHDYLDDNKMGYLLYPEKDDCILIKPCELYYDPEIMPIYVSHLKTIMCQRRSE